MTPRRIWLALAAAVATGCAQPGQTALPESDANAIRQAEKALVASMSDPDPTAWVRFYADDAVFLPPNEPAVQGREALVNYAKTFPPMSSFSLTPVEIAGRGDLAYVYGRYSWVMAPPGAAPQPDSGKYLVIWRKQAEGDWKITRDMFNSDLAPGASAAEAK